MDMNDFVTISGGTVKALPDNKVAGYLVTFSDENSPDLTGDFFTKETDFGKHTTTPTLYHHGLDVKLGGRVIGDATLKMDEIGIWVEAQLNMRDEYEKRIYKMAQKGKLGWSSGTAPHLVRREKVGNSNKITSWMLGLDASLTPTPAEPRNQAISIKSIKATDIETETAEAVSDEIINKNLIKETKMETPDVKKEVIEVKAEEKPKQNISMDVIEKVKRQLEEQNEIKAEEKRQKDELESKVNGLVESFMKNADHVNGGSPRLNLKTKRGDSAELALNHFIKTGDNGGLRANPEYKTDYNLIEGTQYQGQELVPTEVASRIFEMRDKLSMARLAGANVLQVNSSTVNVPFEKVRQGIMVAPGEATAYDQIEQQIFDKKAITITKYTRNIPISEELLEDSVVDLVPYLTNKAGVLAAQVDNAVFITNSTGAWYGSTKGVDAASASAIAVGEPISLLHSLNAEYRDNIVWGCTKTTESLLRGLNTAYSFPYMGNGGASGFLGAGGGTEPNAFLGGRLFNNESIDEYGTTKKPLFVGNFQAGYVICERRALTIRRDESSMSSGLLKILISYRIGGGIVVAEAFQHILMPTA